MSVLSAIADWCRRHGLLATAVVVSFVFACRSLTLIGATSLWSDELSTAYKVYELSFPSLLAYLRSDSHPPLYYSILWLLGQHLDQTSFLLRFVSWLAYGCGGLVMSIQAFQLAGAARLRRPERALALALLLAFTTPFPVRFSIEAKGYALVVALLALALWCRQRIVLADGSPRLPALGGYVLSLALAAGTHYYGLLYAVALVLVDGWEAIRLNTADAHLRRALCGGGVLAIMPVATWVLVGVDRGDARRATSWIGPPDFALLEDVLVRYLGPYPLPKLLALLLLLTWLLRSRRLQGQAASLPMAMAGNPPPALFWLDASGLLAGLLMTALVVAVSFWKPIAFSRYFIVLLPALVVWLSCQLARLEPRGPRVQRAICIVLAVWVLSSWTDSFIGLTRAGPQVGPRESSNFRAVSLAAAPFQLRYGLADRQLDHIGPSVGR
jgi:hypothetical protein